MSKDIHISRYRRKALLYSLVLLVPGIFLSLLAYRGIQGNVIAEQKIRDDRLSRKARFFMSVIEDSIELKRMQHDSLDNFVLQETVRDLTIGNIAILDETISFRNKIVWQIKGQDGDVWHRHPLFDPKKYCFEPEAENTGNWTLELQETNVGNLDLLAQANHLLYPIVFVFVLAAMLIGYILTMRSLRKDYKLARLKSDFVSTVSHEFKSPLTSIRMMSERLVNNRVSDEGRKADYYNSMLAQSERLSHLVENILDFSRIEKGRKNYYFEPCNLLKLINGSAEIFLLRNQDGDLKIDIQSNDDNPLAVIDRQSMQQVWYNLIDNAIKYGGESSRIDIRIKKERSLIKLSIKDYGLGISQKDTLKIFDQFYRSRSIERAGIKGSGIGLSIVAEIVNAHDGRISVESELDKGSMFTIILPIKPKKHGTETIVG